MLDYRLLLYTVYGRLKSNSGQRFYRWVKKYSRELKHHTLYTNEPVEMGFTSKKK